MIGEEKKERKQMNEVGLFLGISPHYIYVEINDGLIELC